MKEISIGICFKTKEQKKAIFLMQLSKGRLIIASGFKVSSF
jgi:hypothetical protein